MIPSERAPQEQQNGTNFSFIALSSEELGLRSTNNDMNLKTPAIVHDFGQNLA